MDAVPELTIDIHDPAFLEALADPRGLLPHLEGAMNAIMTEFVARAEIPAPESEANRPGRVDQDGRPLGYYERGRGWWYPVLTHNRLDIGSELPIVVPHGRAPHTMGARMLLARGLNAAGYKLLPTSEQLEENWQATVSASDQDVIGELTNTASYGSWVQGYDQIDLHRRRGWQTVERTWTDDAMQATVSAETDKALNDYYRLQE